MTILSADQPGAIPDQFIVALCETDELTERGVEDVVRELIARHGGTATHIFNAFRMFALHATTQQALAHAADPAVKYVEHDQFAEPAGIQADATAGNSRLRPAESPLSARDAPQDAASRRFNV